MAATAELFHTNRNLLKDERTDAHVGTWSVGYAYYYVLTEQTAIDLG